MRSLGWLGMLWATGLVVAGAAEAAERRAEVPWLRVRASGPPSPRAGALLLPYQDAGPAAFRPGAEAAHLGGPDPAFAADVWLAQGALGLQVAVEVRDPSHDNGQEGAALWDGDAVQLGLHPLGPEERLAAGNTEAAGDADLLLSLALARGRAAGYAHAAADGWAGPWRGPLEVTRDEGRRRTRYLVTVPWAALGAQVGGLGAVGLSLWVLDGGTASAAGRGRTAPRRLRLGATAAGGVRPCEMVEVRLAPPEQSFAAFGRAEVRGLGAGEQLVVPLRAQGVPAAGPLRVALHCGGRSLRLDGLPTRLRHLVVVNAAICQGQGRRATLGLYGPRGALLAHLALDWPETARDVAVAEGSVARAEAAARAANDALAMGDAQAARALLAHFVAQSAAANDASPRGESAELALVARALAARYREPERLRSFLADGEVPAFGTFVAGADQTLQPYLLFAPRRAASVPAGRRPLLVWLHGRGDARLTRFVADAAEAPGARPGTVRATPDDYVLVPWTRGNLGARGLGGQDVLQAVAEVQAAHPVDAERTYLAGFSLGGSGAFDLAVHAPGPWAAVAIFSGGAWQVSLGHGVGDNARHLPVLLWHGDADGAIDVANLTRIERELGGRPEVNVVPGGGHVFGEAQWRALQTFVAGKQRPTPHTWSYTADGATWRQHRGVWLDVDAARDPFPSVRVAVAPGAEGRATTVRVTSTGTAGLELDLGPQGLDVSGEATVCFQGSRVYRGPPTRLTLGRGAPRP